jgi:putative membrane protein
MEKKSNNSLIEAFITPQKQHITGLLIILLKQYRAALSNFLPLLLFVFIKKDASVYIYYGIGMFLLFYTIYAFLKYYNIKYHLNHQELIYQSGVFTKKKVTIPFENIMNIDYEQNIIQQILDVAQLKVETAGSSKEEIELYALKLDTIKDIRTIIFENKNLETAHSLSSIELTSENSDNFEIPVQRKLIFQLSMLNLLKSGITANHLKTGLLIIALIFSFSQRLQDWKILGDYEEYEESIFNFMSTAKIILLFGFLFLLISIAVSMFRQVILYFELQFFRTADGFYVSSGLFNKKLIAVKDQKIQSVSYKQNILRKLIGMFDFNMQKIGDARHQINIPGMGIEQVVETISILYPDFLGRTFQFAPISHYYFRRAAIYMAGFTLLLLTPLVWLGEYYMIALLIIIVSFLLLSTYLKYKKMQYAVDNNYVIVKGGRFGTSQKIIPISKIQMASITDSPYQRGKNLQSLVITDGGGTTVIPFIDQLTAQHLKEYLIYQIEKV